MKNSIRLTASTLDTHIVENQRLEGDSGK